MEHMGITKWSTVALLAAFALPRAAHAQPRMSGELQGAKRITCTFSVVATGSWDTHGLPKAEIKPASLTMSYDAIDTDDGTARLNGRYGEVPIIAKASIWSLHLLQTGSEGTMRLTTVFDRENGPGKFQAVHTVHEFTPVGLPIFASRPEQYYGECEIGR
jgi:hypothetical protein